MEELWQMSAVWQGERHYFLAYSLEEVTQMADVSETDGMRDIEVRLLRQRVLPQHS